MTRRKRYNPADADAYLRRFWETVQRVNNPAVRDLELRQCSEYHFQFWLGKRCLLNVWPSKQRYQLAETDESSRVGSPKDAAAALDRAIAKAIHKRECHSVEQQVAQAMQCLSGYLLTSDVQALTDAVEIIQSLENELRSSAKRRAREEYIPRDLEYDERDDEDRTGRIFGE